jgi:hypothetical protein
VNIHRPGNWPLGVNGPRRRGWMCQTKPSGFYAKQFSAAHRSARCADALWPNELREGDGTNPRRALHHLFLAVGGPNPAPLLFACYPPCFVPVIFDRRCRFYGPFCRFFKSFLFLQGFTGRELRRRKVATVGSFASHRAGHFAQIQPNEPNRRVCRVGKVGPRTKRANPTRLDRRRPCMKP